MEKIDPRELVKNFDSKRVPLSILEREQRPGKYPYYGAASILDYIDGFLFEGRYLLVGEDGTVITPSGTPMLQLVQGQFWVNNHAHVLQGGQISTEFAYCFLSQYPISGHITGVAQPKITQANLNRIPVLVPAETLANSFQELVAPIFDQVFVQKMQMTKAAEARDFLLPRLMDGRITV
jgi:type I restriction enzyme S subunit